MENRSLKELYQLLLDNFDNIKMYGICNKIRWLWMEDKITLEERNLLYYDFNPRRPKISSKFWWNWNYNQTYVNFWWKLNESGNEQRKLFIQSIIDKL